MKTKWLVVFSGLLLSAAVCFGQEPPRPPITGPAKFKHVAEVKTNPRFTLFPMVVPPDDKVTIIRPPGSNSFYLGGDPGTYRFSGVAFYLEIDWDKRTHEIKTIPYLYEFTIEGPAPGPGPEPAPDPKPKPDPKPAPVTSFRVVIVYESGDSLTPDQRGVLFGGLVETWLTANCTGGKDGWRRRDKDAPWEMDKPFADLWAAVKPKVTMTPCLAIAVNDKVTLEPLPTTPAAAVDLLKKYREGR